MILLYNFEILLRLIISKQIFYYQYLTNYNFEIKILFGKISFKNPFNFGLENKKTVKYNYFNFYINIFF